MTTNDIDAIEARANAATPGEWIYDPDNTGLCFGPHIGLLNSRGVSIPIHYRTDEDAAQSHATAVFIAAARQDVPALCTEVRELRALITAHNERIVAACKWRQENGHCDYAKRGDLCPDCPQEWEISRD